MRRATSRLLMPNDSWLRVGYRRIFHAAPLPMVKCAGTIHCEVLDVEPERRLRMRWAVTVRTGGIRR